MAAAGAVEAFLGVPAEQKRAMRAAEHGGLLLRAGCGVYMAGEEHEQR